MERPGLEGLPRETLIKLLKAYSRNWQTLDGLWFGNVEKEFGLDAAVRLDLSNWRKQAALEARRLRDALGLTEGGLDSVLTVLSFMSWQLTSPLYEVEKEGQSEVVFRYRRCAVQEGRAKQGKVVFPCKTMKLTLLSGIAGIVEPNAVVTCLSCLPDKPGRDYWCRWRLTLK